jgi:pilus assembly protein Flp/PilA
MWSPKESERSVRNATPGSGNQRKDLSDMLQYVKTWLELKTDKRAVTALEYGLIAAVIIGVCVGGFTLLGSGISTQLTTLNSSLN